MQTDYLIKGMDSPTLVYSICGTGHFTTNIKPLWYSLNEVKLASYQLSMVFEPTDFLPERFKSACRHYSISVRPNKSFALIFREFLAENEVRYVIVTCPENEKGEAYFHFEILAKNLEPGEEVGPLLWKTDEELLKKRGYELVKYGDDKTASFFSVLFNQKKAAC